MTTTGESSANDKPARRMTEGRPPAFLTDFDDTAAVQNIAELLLFRFGSPDWTDVRQQFREGKMSLKEYQEITFRDIRADRSAMQHYVREHGTLRPWFPDLYLFCNANGIFPLAVVSQGLDFYISALCWNATASETFPSTPSIPPSTKVVIAYHYNHSRIPGKESQGNSKAFRGRGIPEARGYYVVFAGDGISDLEASRQADMVFAHRTLARYCDEEGIPYTALPATTGLSC